MNDSGTNDKLFLFNNQEDDRPLFSDDAFYDVRCKLPSYTVLICARTDKIQVENAEPKVKQAIQQQKDTTNKKVDPRTIITQSIFNGETKR